MIFTTTPSLEGYRTETDHGVVAGEVIMGANVFRDRMASVTAVIGGRSSACEAERGEALGHALDEAGQRAEALGANAVVCIDVACEVIQQGMLMVAVAGTAGTVSRN